MLTTLLELLGFERRHRRHRPRGLLHRLALMFLDRDHRDRYRYADERIRRRYRRRYHDDDDDD